MDSNDIIKLIYILFEYLYTSHFLNASSNIHSNNASKSNLIIKCYVIYNNCLLAYKKSLI